MILLTIPITWMTYLFGGSAYHEGIALYNKSHRVYMKFSKIMYWRKKES